MTAPTPVYTPGERLQVVLKVDVLSAPDGSIGDYDLGLADGHTLRLPLHHPSLPLKVARLEPVGGTPRAGQIWADRTGAEWWAAQDRDSYSNVTIVLRDANGRSMPWHALHTDPRLGPITLRRDIPASLAVPEPAQTEHTSAPGESR
ncbi:hypothetical protein [Nonomuraea endophytica]|uniref:hypothetical protein n=1 Tax=Nonomuraea endophytica TaxID=714136 RepID=UPI0037CCAADD